MPTQANQPLADGYQLQNYRIRKVLSCGGFSIVYLAHDENDVLMRERECDPVVSKSSRAADLRGMVLKLAIWRAGR